MEFLIDLRYETASKKWRLVPSGGSVIYSAETLSEMKDAIVNELARQIDEMRNQLNLVRGKMEA